MTTMDSRTRFLAVFPVIRAELLAYMDFEKMPLEARNHFERVESDRFPPSFSTPGL